MSYELLSNAERYFGRDAAGPGVLKRPDILDPRKIWPDIPRKDAHQIGSCNYVYSSAEAREHNIRVRDVLTQAINRGEFMGRLALHAIHNGGISGPTQVYHGSSHLPDAIGEKLRPHQPYWRDAEGRLYQDGAPSICFDGNYETPIFMSFFGPRAPGLEHAFRAYHHGADGRSWRMVSRDALETVTQEARTGCVYTVNQRDTYAYGRRVDAFVQYEYRADEELGYNLAVRITPDDLPGDTLIIDADRAAAAKAWGSIRNGVHPLDLTDVSITTFSGVWDIASHPTYRS